jgi:hypothetical protein
MQLFPHCAIAVQVEGGVLRAGSTSRVQVRLLAREAIPRAENVFVTLTATASASYGSGKHRVTRFAEALRLPYRLPVPVGGLPAGEHVYYVDFPIPTWLPPDIKIGSASFNTKISASLDVDWAVDPSATFSVPVLLPPQTALATPLLVRSPVRFHDHVTLELALASTTIVEGTPLQGTVTLRSGIESNFQAIVLSLSVIAEMRFARGDARTLAGGFIAIPKQMFAVGVPVPFVLQAPTTPSFVARDNSFIPTRTQLHLKLDVPWSMTDPGFSVPLTVLPMYSALVPADPRAVSQVGGRFAQLARDLGNATGLVPDTPPALVRGQRDFIQLAIFDAPVSGVPAAAASIEFPSLDLGLETADHSLLDGFRGGTNYLPEPFAQASQLRASHVTQLGQPTVRAFVEQMLSGLDSYTKISLNDAVLQLSRALPSDDAAGFIWFARQVLAQVGRVNQAIANLPWPVAIDADTQARWRQCAVAESATLYAHLPAILGILRPQRVAFGEPRQFVFNLRTEWHEAEPRTLLDLYFPDSPLRMEANQALQTAPPAELHSFMPELHLEGATHLHASCKGIVRDPASLIAAAENLVAWVLAQRGEQVTQSAYR